MKKSIMYYKKKRGRPASRGGEYDPITTIRLPRDLGNAIAAWCKANVVRGRSEAIRQLLELGLSTSPPAKQRSQKSKAKASDMAAHQIDKLANLAIPEEERRARKRRLIKGPREFRDIRGDQPKPKS